MLWKVASLCKDSTNGHQTKLSITRRYKLPFLHLMTDTVQLLEASSGLASLSNVEKGTNKVQ